MITPPLRAHGATHPGRQRANNEDRLHYDAARGLFIVADGMGGHAAGERAADTAVAVLREHLAREDYPPAERLREAFAAANNTIHQQATSEPAWAGMACVATAAIVRDGRVTVGHVGDTRGYRLRHGDIRKITRDHSPVGEREDRGEITEHDAMHHPRRNEVFRDVGSKPREATDADFVEIAEFPFDDDTALLLCTDGLTDLVPSDVLVRIVARHAGDGATVVERLIDAANAAGGRDNVSVVYVEGPSFAASVPAWPVGSPGGRESRSPAPPHRRLTGVLLACGGAVTALLVAWLAMQLTSSVPDWLLGQTRPPSWTRTWIVGAGDAADAATIADALTRARPGDTVRVEPGIYREQVVLDSVLHLVSARPREAVITPPNGAQAGWTAVRLRPGAIGRFSGFTVAGDDTRVMSVGIEVAEPAARLDDVEVRGARRAGIEVMRGAGGAISACYIHDNAGVGILIGDEGQPSLLHNVVTRNGAGLPVPPSSGSPPAGAASGGRPGAPAAGSGVVAAASSRPLLFGNIIIRNAGGDLAGFDVDELSDARRDNIIELAAAPSAAAVRPQTPRGSTPPRRPR